MRLLVVEDGLTERTLLEALFLQSGSVHFVLATTLAEATKLLSQVDFVVLDLMLPDAVPEQSLEWIRGCGRPVVVYSGNWSNEIITLAAEAGALNFLTKGSTADQIMAAVHFALAREKLLFECREQRVAACQELAERMRSRLLISGEKP